MNCSTPCGGSAPRSAAKTVQTYLSALRRALPAGAIETVSGSYRLAVGPDDVDTARFERLAAVGAAAVVSGDAAAAAGYLKQALSLWRGQALEDLADQPPGTAEAARLEELRRSAEEEQAEAGLALGRHHRLVGELEVLVAKEPFRERRWRLLMLALYRSGRQSDACGLFNACGRNSVNSWVSTPSGELRGLEEAVLLQKPALDWHGPDADDGSGAQDSGPEIFAGLATRTNNLPSSLSSFVGRAEHAALVRRLVSSHRLVTLAGAGGIGKTRLATEPPGGLVATFEDGVWLVELAGLSRGRSSAGCGGGARRPRSPAARRYATWSRPSGTVRCWWCSTTANTSSNGAPSWPRRWTRLPPGPVRGHEQGAPRRRR